MPDYKAARVNMVDSQIHPMGVVSEAVLDAFRTIPREEFVAQDKRGVAYGDEDMPIGAGRCLMEPVTHARLLQAATLIGCDSVLDVGCGSGYSAAILSKLASKIVAVEPDAGLLAHAEKAWRATGCSGIIPHQGPFADGCATHAPYSLIIINAAVAEIPEVLADQLAPGGRLLAVLRRGGDKIGRAVLVLKSEDGKVGQRVLFDAAVPWFPGHEPEKTFVF